MFHSLRDLLSALTPGRHRARKRRPQAIPVRPALETLERRDTPTFSYANGVLTIHAFETASNATVTKNGSTLRIEQKCALGCFEGGVMYDASMVNKIVFIGGANGDTFRNETAIASLAYGNGGDDWLYGGSGTDELYGGQNNDHLFGGFGEDWLYGEAGNDHLDGGKFFADHLTGGIGADTFQADMVPLGYFLTNADRPTDFRVTDGDVYSNA